MPAGLREETKFLKVLGCAVGTMLKVLLHALEQKNIATAH